MTCFSDILRKTRKKQGMTQDQLSEKFNLSRDTISSWENGKSVPNINQLQQLCNIFDCDAGYLLGEFETKRAAAIPGAAATHLSEKAIDNLLIAFEQKNPYFEIVCELLEDEELLNQITYCCKVDYGNISAIVNISDIFSEKERNILINPKTLARADAEDLRTAIMKFVSHERKKNNLSALY